jgi:hypothetical protein
MNVVSWILLGALVFILVGFFVGVAAIINMLNRSDY